MNDTYWYHISLLVQQYNGLIDGYMKYSDKPLRRWNILSMVLSGDYPDINSAIQNKLNEEDHCSALIKLLPNNSDLIVSQDTWTSFNSMIRIWKIYDFPWKMNKDSKEIVPNRIMSFSSYPGYMFSGDDFYLLSNNMVVQETTIGNHNISLNKYIKPDTVYIWMRNMVANRISSNGKEWCEIFKKYNNGCYNNEFMIIDYKLFHPGEELKDGILFVLEQLPGNIIYDDLTQYKYIKYIIIYFNSVLKNQTYFPSYNLPYFSQIKDLMNLDELIEQYGDYYTYENTSRALIFKREHKNIKDLKDMRYLMRYNNYQHDEYSHCNCTPNGYSSSLAIATRGDLNPIDGTYSPPGLGHRNHVATDSKITCYDMIVK